jgi:arylsulfatase A-like enzyme
MVALLIAAMLFAACSPSDENAASSSGQQVTQSSGGAPSTAAGDRPNIVFILADDLGWGDVGYHGSEIKTPVIDRLAETGVRFDQFYASSVCSPTRACFMTGRYTMRYGLQTGVIRPWAEFGLPTNEVTLADAMRRAGYTTSICGKWHLGHASRAYIPTERGFDHAYGHYNGAIDYFTHIRDGGIDWHRNDEPLEEEGYSTTLIAHEACRVIGAHNTAKPLFMYVSFNAPHFPLQAPPEYINRYANISHPGRRTYAAMVTAMDDAIGEILDALDKKKMRGNTLVFFCSDNGGDLQISSNGRLRGGKSDLYEGGIRVPAIAHWPGVLSPRVERTSIHMVDLFPTFVGLARGSIDPTVELDGIDVWPTIKTGRPTGRNELAFDVSQLRGAIRVGDWKLIYNGHLKAIDMARKGPDRWELFNLAADPFEQKDLALANPEKVIELKARLESYIGAAADPLLAPNKPPANYRPPRFWARFVID